jgi:hypothetical protein
MRLNVNGGSRAEIILFLVQWNENGIEKIRKEVENVFTVIDNQIIEQFYTIINNKIRL